MSAGQSARRGYAYTVRATTERRHSRSAHRTEELVTVIAAATIIFVVVAALTDPVIAASFQRTFGTAWSDIVALLTRR